MRSPQRWAIRAIAAIFALGTGAALIPSLLLPFVSLFAFDDPRATAMVQPYLLVAVLWAIPALLVAGAIVAVRAVVRPTWRSLMLSIGLVAIPAAFGAWLFDPLHLRRYPPATNCIPQQKGPQRGQWVCSPLAAGAFERRADHG